ncbi:TPA: hypothetical protein ACGWTM_003413 [Legionella pneumophila]
MVCIVEFDDGLRFNFAKNKYKQKVWIDALLKYSKANIDHLSKVLDVPLGTLVKVHNGGDYLDQEAAERLGQLFLLSFYE